MRKPYQLKFFSNGCYVVGARCGCTAGQRKIERCFCVVICQFIRQGGAYSDPDILLAFGHAGRGGTKCYGGFAHRSERGGSDCGCRGRGRGRGCRRSCGSRGWLGWPRRARVPHSEHRPICDGRSSAMHPFSVGVIPNGAVVAVETKRQDNPLEPPEHLAVARISIAFHMSRRECPVAAFV